MTLSLHISGTLYGEPESRTASTGRTYVKAKVVVTKASRNGNEPAKTFVGVTAFRDSVCERLLQLGDGDSVSVAGELEPPRTYQDKTGTWRASLDMVAQNILTAADAKAALAPKEAGETQECGPASGAAPAPRQRAPARARREPAPAQGDMVTPVAGAPGNGWASPTAAPRGSIAGAPFDDEIPFREWMARTLA